MIEIEIEIGVMVSPCLDRRIPTKAMLIREVKAWERARNRRQGPYQVAIHPRAGAREARQVLSLGTS